MARDKQKAGPRKVGAFLPGNLANALNHRLDEGLRLQQAWISAVSGPLASYARPVRYAGGLLYIHVDTPTWASRLRHQQAGLINLLRRYPGLRDLSELRIRVVPQAAEKVPSTPAIRPKTRLSAKASQIIKSSTSSIADPKLRAAFERLAERGDSSHKAKH